MSLATVAIMAGAVGIGAWILAPLLRADAVEAERVARRTSARQEWISRRDQLLAALRDLEDDLETGKMSVHDHAELKARLTAEAAEVMQRIDEDDAARQAEVVRPHPTAVPRP